MFNRKEFFRQRHPEQFSDSKIGKSYKFSKEFFDFFLSSLSNMKKETEFELFCKRLIEKVVCPNLIPQTGPTGGGDSKVDSETFPVSDSISERWFYADAKKASTERWAFAFSVKKDWKPKAKSDIKKIYDVNVANHRGFTKVFFVSNQAIPDKKRADSEDDFKDEYGLDVRILDRYWLIDNTFKNNVDIAIDTFNMEIEYTSDMIKGAGDFKKEKELEVIEKELSKQSTNTKDIIELSQRSLVLNRELEVPFNTICGLIERNIRLAEEYGTTHDKDNAIYDACWTIFWWYDSPEEYYKYYQQYESATIGQSNVEYIVNLSNLWMNLYTLALGNAELCNISNHNQIVISEHKKYIDDPTKPNASLVAKASYQNIRLMLGEDVNDIVDEMIIIFDASAGVLNFDYEIMAKIVLQLPVYKEAKRYTELCEMIIKEMGEKKHNRSIAELLVDQGDACAENPYSAIKYYGRAVNKLVAYESKDDLELTLIKLATCYKAIGLHWAARSYAMNALCLLLEDFYNYGNLKNLIIPNLVFLRKAELQLGMILNSTEIYKIENMTRKYLNTAVDNEDIEAYNYLLGLQMLRTDFNILNRIERLPDYFRKLGLDLAEAALRYEYGHYDKEIMEQVSDKDAFDDLIQKWFAQTQNMDFVGCPCFNTGKYKVCMSSKISGCKINLYLQDNVYLLEFGVAILSLIESFFATSIVNSLIPQVKSIDIEVIYDTESNPFKPKIIEDKKRGVIKIKVQQYSISDITRVHDAMSEFNVEIIAFFTAKLFPLSFNLEKIEDMIRNEDALGRSLTFANAFVNINEAFGCDTFSYTDATRDCDTTELIRNEKSPITSIQNNEKFANTTDGLSIGFKNDQDHNEFSLDNIKHDDIDINSIIDIPLWNSAGWKGTATGAFQFQPNILVPFIAFIFSSNAGYDIYKRWIHSSDKDAEQLKIGIIKGIDKNHPYWYRVIIGSEMKSNAFSDHDKDKHKIIYNAVRFHTMEANSDENIKRFESFLKDSDYFITYPCEMHNCNEAPQNNVIIKKPIRDIQIINAWELKSSDIFISQGIHPNDDPVIPKGCKNAYIQKYLENIKQFSRS